MVPQMVSEVIRPLSTSVAMEPCRSRILACRSYDKLQQLRSSSVFKVYPAIGRFAVGNETAAATTLRIITGADSATFDDVTISKRAHATVGTRAYSICGNCLADFVWLAVTLFHVPLICVCATVISAQQQYRVSMAFPP